MDSRSEKSATKVIAFRGQRFIINEDRGDRVFNMGGYPVGLKRGGHTPHENPEHGFTIVGGSSSEIIPQLEEKGTFIYVNNHGVLATKAEYETSGAFKKPADGKSFVTFADAAEVLEKMQEKTKGELPRYTTR